MVEAVFNESGDESIRFMSVMPEVPGQVVEEDIDFENGKTVILTYSVNDDNSFVHEGKTKEAFARVQEIADGSSVLKKSKRTSLNSELALQRMSRVLGS